MDHLLEAIQEAYIYSIALESFIKRDVTKRGDTKTFVSAEAAMRMAREISGKDKKGNQIKPNIEHFKAAIEKLTNS